MMSLKRIPVVVLAGFLGSGKTTLLNNLIQQAEGQKIIALVNDFGALNIDADLVVGVEGNTVSFANGCICCTIHDDLATECVNILESDEWPDLVLVELSGVSEPGPVMNTFLETDLKPFFDLSAVVTVVDAEGWQNLDTETRSLSHAQINAADLIALSKTDLTATGTIASVLRDIETNAPNAQVFEAPRGQFSLNLLLDLTFDHEAPRTNGRSPHKLSSVHWNTAESPLALPRLEEFLAALPPGIARVKGFVWMEELPQFKFLVQAVGRRYDVTCLGNWDDTEPETNLVLIGTENCIVPERLHTQLEACVGTGDESASPILRLVKRIAPEFLESPAA